MEDADTYWVTDPRQLMFALSPRRQDIVDHLAAAGPLSVRELAGRIGAKPSALYHHIKALLDVGLLLEAGSRATGGRTEKLYRTPAPRMRLYRALQDPANHRLFVQIVAALSRQAARDFERGVASPRANTSGEGRNLGMCRMIGAPDAEALAKINGHLDAVMELMWGSAAGPERISLSWVMAPSEDEDPVD